MKHYIVIRLHLTIIVCKRKHQLLFCYLLLGTKQKSWCFLPFHLCTFELNFLFSAILDLIKNRLQIWHRWFFVKTKLGTCTVEPILRKHKNPHLTTVAHCNKEKCVLANNCDVFAFKRMMASNTREGPKFKSWQLVMLT